MQFSLVQGIEIRELFGSRIGYHFLGSQQGYGIEIRDKALFHYERVICVANFLSGVPFFHHQVNTFFTYQKTGKKAKTINIKKVLPITARDFMNDTAKILSNLLPLGMTFVTRTRKKIIQCALAVIKAALTGLYMILAFIPRQV